MAIQCPPWVKEFWIWKEKQQSLINGYGIEPTDSGVNCIHAYYDVKTIFIASSKQFVIRKEGKSLTLSSAEAAHVADFVREIVKG